MVVTNRTGSPRGGSGSFVQDAPPSEVENNIPALKFELEGKEVVVRAGETLMIPSNVPHRAVALEDTLDIDIFSPIRHDWLAKDDSYLRRGLLETDAFATREKSIRTDALPERFEQ